MQVELRAAARVAPYQDLLLQMILAIRVRNHSASPGRIASPARLAVGKCKLLSCWCVCVCVCPCARVHVSACAPVRMGMYQCTPWRICNGILAAVPAAMIENNSGNYLWLSYSLCRCLYLCRSGRRCLNRCRCVFCRLETSEI